VGSDLESCIWHSSQLECCNARPDPAPLGLALLLASQPTRDNLGLLRPNLDRSTPLAQKNGWLNDARHTAAIIYRKSGPTIVVLLTYRPAITRPEAATFAAKVLKAVFNGNG
jgi:hypothetical protein